MVSIQNTLTRTDHSPGEPGKGPLYAEHSMFKYLTDNRVGFTDLIIASINFYYLKLLTFLGFVTNIPTLLFCPLVPNSSAPDS